jgi:hypothetical protein
MDSHDDLSRLFDFERDFAGNLRCVPMAVRFKLDVVGVKISLRDWAKFSHDEREELLQHPFTRPSEMETFRARVCELVRAHGGGEPASLPFDDLPVWEQAFAVPANLQQQATQMGVQVSPESWATLTPLRRFALVKLSRPKHDNLNFLPALREFQLVS